jgi:hypothetical protein
VADATPLTREQAAIVGLFTGTLAGPFSDVHKLAEDLAGHPIWTHEFVSRELMDDLKEKCKPLFLSICAPKENDEGEKA